MPTYTKTYTAAGAEGWTDEALSSNLTFTVTAADGNPQPSLQFSAPSIPALSSDADGAKSGTTADTFESIFGIPPGSIITSILCSSVDYRYAGSEVFLPVNRTGNLRIRAVNQLGVNVCIDDLILVNTLPTTVQASWLAQTNTTDTPVSGGALASNTVFQLDVNLALDAGATLWTTPTYRFDNIIITVTATIPVTTDAGVGNESLPPLLPPQLNNYQKNFLKLPLDSSDKEAGGTPLSGADDEDFDPNRLLLPGPFPLKEYVKLPITDDSDTPALFGQDDEDFWNNMVAPLIGNNFQPLPRGFVSQTEDQAVVSTTLGPEEEFWRRMVTPVPPGMYQQLPVWAFKDAGEISPGSAPLGPAVILRKWMSVQQANLWVVCRVAATGVFNLDLLTTADPDNGPNYIIDQRVSTPLAGVDGTTSTYTNHVQLSVPWPATGQLQIYGASGLAYYADVRFYYKLRHRRR